MIKATAGGGGRGMRPCFNEDDFIALLPRRLATRPIACFGNGECLHRKARRSTRITSSSRSSATRHGNVVHLGERDCSMQRRNQKIIEECPSPLLTPELRKRMGDASVKLCKDIGYRERRHHRVPRR